MIKEAPDRGAAGTGMTQLKIRNLPWRFGGDTPFQWNPANPAFGLGMNTLSFLGPAFERYIVTAVREAMHEIRDPGVRREADAFLTQEALHASAHRAHVKALTAQYPGLEEVSTELDRRFDELLANEPLHFHLAYIADIEATFTPMFDLFLRHRDRLFDNGDPRVAPLFLWHFVEEIEHRSSALIVYDEVVGKPWYRFRQVPKVFSHMAECANTCGRGFNRHVPKEVRLAEGLEDATLSPIEILKRSFARRGRGASAPSASSGSTGASVSENLVLACRLLRAQIPGHSPANERTPPFADEWIEAHERGKNVVDWYGVDSPR